jgi:hypothetical protein
LLSHVAAGDDAGRRLDRPRIAPPAPRLSPSGRPRSIPPACISACRPRAPSELSPSARLSDLLERLDQAFARRRSSDVAHELRTPIAESNHRRSPCGPDDAGRRAARRVADCRADADWYKRLDLVRRARAGGARLSFSTPSHAGSRDRDARRGKGVTVDPRISP